MPRPMTEKERQGFLAEPRIGVLSVAEGDRPPHATPVWYGYEPGGDLTFFTGTQGRRSRKAGLVERAGAVSLTVHGPFRYVTVKGPVGIDRPPSPEQVLAVAHRYLPEEQARGFFEAELGFPPTSLCSSRFAPLAG